MGKSFIKILVVSLSLFVLPIICSAEVMESVTGGRTIQYTSKNVLPLDENFNVEISLASDIQRAFNFSMDVKFIPKNKGKQADAFLPDIFFSVTPIFSYWESANPNGYKITSYNSKNSKKLFYKDGYKVNLSQGEIKNSTSIIYIPGNINMQVGYTFTGDYTKKPIKGVTNWSSNTDFGKFMLNNLKQANPFVININYYYSEVDAVKAQNYKRCMINVDGNILKEWSEVFAKAGF